MVIVFFSGLCGMIVTSLLISNITEQLNLASNEELAYGIISKLSLSAEVEEKTTSAFKSLVRLRKLKNQPESAQIEVQKIEKEEEEFQMKIKELRDARKEYKDFEIGNTDRDNERNFELVTRELKEIRKLVFAIYNKSIEMGIISKNPTNRLSEARGMRRQGPKMSIESKVNDIKMDGYTGKKQHSSLAR